MRGDEAGSCVHGGYYLQSVPGLFGRAQSLSWRMLIVFIPAFGRGDER
jgi:hypothetical protein